MRRRKDLSAVVGIGLFLGVAGVLIFALSARPEESSSPGDIQREYSAVIQSLEFPPDFQPRAEDPAAAQGSGVFVGGVGAVDAGNAWFCAWAFEWDKYRNSDPARASRALDTIAGSYPTGPFWESLAAPDGAGLKREIDQARLGSPQAMAAEIDAFGCSRR